MTKTPNDYLKKPDGKFAGSRTGATVSTTSNIPSGLRDARDGSVVTRETRGNEDSSYDEAITKFRKVIDSTEQSETYSCGNPSSFGCGSHNCVTCYPFTYRCECGADYPQPIPNGQPMPVCDACGIDIEELSEKVVPLQKPVKYLSCVETATLLRNKLKETFKGTKISVVSDKYAGGASISVSWTDGPTDKEVSAIAGGYAGATFDGMIDLKSYHRSLIVLPGDTEETSVRFGADFVFTDRDLSKEFKDDLATIAQTILSNNRDTMDKVLDRTCHENYPSLGSDYGTFQGGNAENLIHWLGEQVTPKQAKELHLKTLV
jgi:hypothetical protein